MEQPLLLDSFGFEIEPKKDPWLLDNFPVVLGATAVAAMLLFVSYSTGRGNGLLAGRKESTTGWTIGTLTTGAGFAYGDVPKKVVTSGPKRDALMWAVDQWRKELGTLPIPLPVLYEGTDYSCTSLGALACAHLSDGSITVASHEPFSFDLRTVLMHEIGHLLGVPHIDGDPLMNAEYSVKLDKPTGASIALAKLAIAKKKRPS